MFYYYFLIVSSCKNKNDSDYHKSLNGSSFSEEYEQDYSDEEDEFTGNYCAEVEYFNPNTGSRNIYELDVEVEDGLLIQINWPNGGWLDETHFTSEDISSGECSFISDKGYNYTVTLGEKGGGCNNEGTQLRNDVNEDVENSTCPICGEEKDEYEENCYICNQKIEDDEEEQRLQEEERRQEMVEENSFFKSRQL